MKFIRIILTGICAFSITNQFMKITLKQGLTLTALPVLTIASVIVGIAGLAVLIEGIQGVQKTFSK